MFNSFHQFNKHLIVREILYWSLGIACSLWLDHAVSCLRIFAHAGSFAQTLLENLSQLPTSLASTNPLGLSGNIVSSRKPSLHSWAGLGTPGCGPGSLYSLCHAVLYDLPAITVLLPWTGPSWYELLEGWDYVNIYFHPLHIMQCLLAANTNLIMQQIIKTDLLRRYSIRT